MKEKAVCDFCGKSFMREAAQLRAAKFHFCSRKCATDFSSKAKNPERYKLLKDYSKIGRNFSVMNAVLNKTRMTPEVREKVRQAQLDRGKCKTYRKYHGRHEHRVVAEQILGRPLRKGEVVHHSDGNVRNNTPNNLIVFSSQADHARYHAELRWFLKEIRKMEEGDAE